MFSSKCLICENSHLVYAISAHNEFSFRCNCFPLSEFKKINGKDVEISTLYSFLPSYEERFSGDYQFHWVKKLFKGYLTNFLAYRELLRISGYWKQYEIMRPMEFLNHVFSTERLRDGLEFIAKTLSPENVDLEEITKSLVKKQGMSKINS